MPTSARSLRTLLLPLLATLLGGCLDGGQRAPAGPSAGPLRLQFWHTRRGDQEKALNGLIGDYNRSQSVAQVEPVYQGSYERLGQKIRASIQAGDLPALSVAYESNVTEYMANRALVPLDPLVKDPEIGLTDAELADIPEAYLTVNRFPQFGNQLLSFPFTKSNLLLYYNKTLLAQAGFQAPPDTWDEFERQAAAVTARTRKPAFAFDSDPSTLDGMVYAFGGEVLAPDGKTTLFDRRPMRLTLELLQRMKRAGTLVPAGGDEAAGLFLAGQAAFLFNTSSGRAQAEAQIGTAFDWDVAVIPHAAGVAPVTVMYGPNVCIFKAPAGQGAREREAWKFVKWFTSPEVTARWARETGYLPVRRSAVELPEMRAFYAETPRARKVYDLLRYARGEPNVLGWQEVRDLLKDAAEAVMNTNVAPAQAAAELKKKADRALAESR